MIYGTSLTDCLCSQSIRFASENIGSPPWKTKSTRYVFFVAVALPILLGGYVFSGVIGGEEIALIDVPYVNQAAGFSRLPRGCDSIVDTTPEPTWCAWSAGQAGLGTTRSWETPSYMAPGGNHTVRISEHGSPTTTETVDSADICGQAA